MHGAPASRAASRDDATGRTTSVVAFGGQSSRSTGVADPFRKTQEEPRPHASGASLWYEKSSTTTVVPWGTHTQPQPKQVNSESMEGVTMGISHIVGDELDAVEHDPERLGAGVGAGEAGVGRTSLVADAARAVGAARADKHLLVRVPIALWPATLSPSALRDGGHSARSVENA